MNEAGVAIGNEAVYTTLDPRAAPPALIGMDLVRLGLERAATAQDAVDTIITLLERYGQGGTGHDPAGRLGPKAYWSSFLVADPATAFVLETSGSTWAAEPVDAATAAGAISNRTTIEAFDREHRHPRQPVASLVDPRWHASQRVLAQRPVSVASIAAHLRSHDSCAVDGWSVCMHGAGDDGELVECTTSSIIAELPPNGASPTAWVLRGSPCVGQYTEVTVTDRLPAGPIDGA